jgi:hypothetical protein
LRVCGSGEQATAFIRWREIIARDMVQANWLHIALVAGQLLERERLSYADLDSIIVPRAGVIRVTYRYSSRSASPHLCCARRPLTPQSISETSGKLQCLVREDQPFHARP